MKRYKRIIFIVGLVMAFSLAGMRSSVFAGDDEHSRETLKGLSGVYVNEIYIDDVGLNAGLNKKQIQIDVELKLRLAGIKVLKESLVFDGVASLDIRIKTRKSSEDIFIYFCFIELNQVVHLFRDANIRTAVATWGIMPFGRGRINNIRSSVKDGVDIFINAYLSVNPKK